ncbi:hypothetical protein AAC387_Pa06g1588 [Persea americana]
MSCLSHGNCLPRLRARRGARLSLPSASPQDAGQGQRGLEELSGGANPSPPGSEAQAQRTATLLQTE